MKKAYENNLYWTTVKDYMGSNFNAFPLYRASSETITISGSKWHERHSCFSDNRPIYTVVKLALFQIIGKNLKTIHNLETVMCE